MKIVDFGIAKAAGAMLRTNMNTFMGTMPYMAPELFTHPDQADESIDVYALGVLAIECLRGRHPLADTKLGLELLTSSDIAKWAQYHNQHPILPSAALVETLPDPASSALEMLLRSMSAKKQTLRPSMASVYEELCRISGMVEGTPNFRTFVPTPPEPMSRQLNSRRSDDPYARPITRNNPVGIIILIDQSGSMSASFGGDQHHLKCEIVARVVNSYLNTLIQDCMHGSEIYDHYFVRVIGFGAGGVRSLLSDDWMPVSRLDSLGEEIEPPGASEPVCVWVKPAADGRTPGVAALAKAIDYLDEWSASHPLSHPPILFVVSDGEFNESNSNFERTRLRLNEHVAKPLIFCAHVSSVQSEPLLFPEALPHTLERHSDAASLWSLSSVLPPRMRMNMERSLRGHPRPLSPDIRGYMFNVVSAQDLLSLFRAGTPRN